jgi:hypothetical protein
MTDDPVDKTQIADTGSGEELSAGKPFQFTLRTLFLLTLAVALVCSAAVTFNGMTRILAFTVVLWAVVGVACWKMRRVRSTIVAYLGGPLYGVVLWIGSACRDSVWEHEWQSLLAVGFFVGAALSVVIIGLRRRW